MGEYDETSFELLKKLEKILYRKLEDTLLSLNTRQWYRKGEKVSSSEGYEGKGKDAFGKLKCIYIFKKTWARGSSQ